MLSDAIITAFRKKSERGWNGFPMYWAIDLHDVIIHDSYTPNNDHPRFMYSGAEEVLQLLSKRKDMSLILFTSSYDKPINDILRWLDDESNIRFDYINGNPECKNTELCDFSRKFYFDIMLEDKAGFNARSDWWVIRSTLKNIGEWTENEHTLDEV